MFFPKWTIGPKDVAGMVVGLAKLPDGSGRLVMWHRRTRSWAPAIGTDLGEVMAAPPASDRLLRELRVPIADVGDYPDVVKWGWRLAEDDARWRLQMKMREVLRNLKPAGNA